MKACGNIFEQFILDLLRFLFLHVKTGWLTRSMPK